MRDVLFEITQEQLDTGLRGYPVGYCTTSSVDATKGLFYCGRSISDVAYQSPEEIIYLLYHGEEGSQEQLADFKKEISKRSVCSKQLIEAICHLPREGQPMKLLASAVIYAGIFDSTGNYREDCLNLIARMPEITATVINHHAGWKQSYTNSSESGYIERFISMLNFPGAKTPDLIEVMRLFNLLHYDHGGGNLSTFVGKAVASGLEDMYGSIAAALLALNGPKHGRANQDCFDFVQSIIQELGEDASAEKIEEWMRKKLAEGALIFGFGHAVLRIEDPRAVLFYDICERNYSQHKLVKIAQNLRKVGPKVLSENPKISNPYPNVDAISGITLTVAGFPYPQYFAVLFGLSRVVGIARQIVYERLEARGGRGTPIYRPKYLYQGKDCSSG